MLKIEQVLHKAGYKTTPPRLLVAEVIEASSHHHLSANEIWEAVKAVDESIGRMSVYRTLDLFTRIGYIRPAFQGAADTRNSIVYVMLENGHHHHIVCQNCHQVIEFEDCGLEQLVKKLEEKYSCAIEGHLLEFFGICSNCRNA